MSNSDSSAAVMEAIKPAEVRRTRYRWWVMFFIFVIYTVANADRANIGFALPYLRKEFEMSNTEAGMIISLFFFGYAAFQIPAGILIRKFGIRTTFAVGMFMTSIFTGIIGASASAFHLKVMRLLIGVAETPVVVGCTSTINNWFPSKEKGTATGIFLAGSKLGPLIVPPICAWIILNFGWREIFVFFMVPGLLLSVFWYVMVRNHPHESRFVSEAERDYIANPEKPLAAQGDNTKKREYKMRWLDRLVRARKVEPLTNNAEVFRCWDIYGAALGYFFLVGIVSVLMSWLPSYLINVKQFAIMKTAFVSASPFVGTVAGNFIGGWLSDNFLNKRRKPLIMLTAFSTTFMMYSLVYAPADPYLLASLLFTTGLFLSLGYSAFAVYGMGRATKEAYPVAWGCINMGGQLGGAAMPLIVGVILDAFNWDAVFAAMAIGSFICLLIVSTIVEPVDDPLV